MKKLLKEIFNQHEIDDSTFEVLLVDYSDHYKNTFEQLINELNKCHIELNKYTEMHEKLKSEIDDYEKKRLPYTKDNTVLSTILNNPELTEKLKSNRIESLNIYNKLIKLENPKLKNYAKAIELYNTKIEALTNLLEIMVKEILVGGESIFNDFTLGGNI